MDARLTELVVEVIIIVIHYFTNFYFILINVSSIHALRPVLSNDPYKNIN